MSKIKLSKSFIRSNVKLALNEDLYPHGDITSSLIRKNKIISAKIISNEKAKIAGVEFVRQVFNLIDNSIKLIIKKKRWITSKKRIGDHKDYRSSKKYSYRRKSGSKFSFTFIWYSNKNI